MKRLSLFFSLVLTVLAITACNTTTPVAGKLQALMITGDDVAPAHNWKEVAPATRDILTSSGKFDVKVVETVSALDSAADLRQYDVIILAMYNAKTPTLSPQARTNLLNFVRGGKGFVVTHLASASFKDWPEFRELCGRYWVMGKSGHGPRAPFHVKITDQKHPITQGLKDFEADDELYAKLQGDTPIRVLATADSDWSKQTEPLVFVHEYGSGRVFHETFGHDVKALSHPTVRTIIQRGTEWAATGRVK